MNVVILRRKGLGNKSTLGIKEHSKNNIKIIRNDRVIPKDTNILVRWGCTSSYNAEKTINKSKAISLIANKYMSRRIMKNAGVNIPELYEDVNDNITYPVIVRPYHHHQGKNLWKCDEEEELIELTNNLKEDNIKYYISQYINKEKEYGVFIFNGRVWSVIEKVGKEENANDNIAWNVNQGSHSFKNLKWSEWPIEVCKEALDAYKCFEIDFARVDVMVKDNKPYILELNSAHSLTSNYRQKTFSKCLDYYIENGKMKNSIDLSKVKTYKSIIHPCLRVNKLKTNL